MLLALLLLSPVQATDLLQVDAAAAGMTVQVNILRDGGGFTGSELVTTSCADITVGPAFALDRAADPSSPVSGAALSTVFHVDSAASAADCTVYVDGIALSAFNAGIDNIFQIVSPYSAPTDGGASDADGTVDGVITLPSSLRSDGGSLVLESLSVAAGETLVFDTTDPDSATDGNEAFLPLVLVVQGAVSIEGTIDLSGEDGGYASASVASDGGGGGPGGGGGGVGGNCLGGAYAAGDGFTGGGGTVTDGCTDFGVGGTGAADGPDGEHGGEGIFTSVENGAVGYAGGTGGGTGSPWGTGGGGGEAYVVSGDGGFGGGGGAGHCDDAGWGNGGGGFGSAGENGMGELGGARSDDDVGGAGLASGDDSLVPLAGGSGGAGGESGSGYADGAGGGGGGGALLIQAQSISFGSGGLIDASGGTGGDTYGVNPGSSTGGGGGSGGGVHLAAASISGLDADSVDLSGGYAGATSNGDESGDGGEGRLRVDGAELPTLGAGPTGELPSSWQGPAISSVADTEITTSTSGTATLYIYDSSGSYITDLALAEDDTVDVASYLAGGDNLLVLVDDSSGVLGPAGVAVIAVPDADGDGYDDASYGGDDCDDGDAAINPSATEICDGVDNDCDGSADEDDASDASTWYADSDGDGFGDAASTTTACSQPSGYVAYDADADCDDSDAAVNPDATELCNGSDDDCDGSTDEDGAADASTWYADSDGDGYGDAGSTTVSCSAPSGYVADASDCDDSDAALNPDTPWYIDYDGDGYGSSAYLVYQCEQPSGYVADASDCDDTDGSAWPGASESCDGVDNDCDGLVDDADPDVSGGGSWYADGDGDGFGDASSTSQACEQPSGSAENSGDCDDSDAAVNPDATELCNGVDDDCDGSVDEDGAADASTWYADSDGDGYGDPDSSTASCSAPAGYLANSEDCDDSDAAINPPASELCDGIDNDCDELVDEDDAADAGSWYLDSDGDGYGDPGSSTSSCDQPSGYLADDTDCDDSDAAVNPDAEETWYDGVDQDCDGNDDDQDLDGYPLDDDCDDTDADTHPEALDPWYDGVDSDCAGDSDYDADGDGYDSASYGGDDCDDADADTWPGAPDEPYDGVVNDCDEADEYDSDGDGHDAEAYGGDDCDDANSAIHPDAEEAWYDGVDQDCDGNDDDQDGDGYALDDDCDDEDASVYPGAEGWDEDCNPVVDDTGQRDTGEPPDSGDSGGPADSGEGVGFKGGGGCDCTASSAPSPRWLLPALLAGLLLRRRRR